MIDVTSMVILWFIQFFFFGSANCAGLVYLENPCQRAASVESDGQG